MPFSEILFGIVAMVVAGLGGWFVGGRDERQRRKIQNEKDKRLRVEAEFEAETQDDISLIDRITDRNRD